MVKKKKKREFFYLQVKNYSYEDRMNRIKAKQATDTMPKIDDTKNTSDQAKIQTDTPTGISRFMTEYSTEKNRGEMDEEDQGKKEINDSTSPENKGCAEGLTIVNSEDESETPKEIDNKAADYNEKYGEYCKLAKEEIQNKKIPLIVFINIKNLEKFFPLENWNLKQIYLDILKIYNDDIKRSPNKYQTKFRDDLVINSEKPQVVPTLLTDLLLEKIQTVQCNLRQMNNSSYRSIMRTMDNLAACIRNGLFGYIPDCLALVYGRLQELSDFIQKDFFTFEWEQRVNRIYNFTDLYIQQALNKKLGSNKEYYYLPPKRMFALSEIDAPTPTESLDELSKQLTDKVQEITGEKDYRAMGYPNLLPKDVNEICDEFCNLVCALANLGAIETGRMTRLLEQMLTLIDDGADPLTILNIAESETNDHILSLFRMNAFGSKYDKNAAEKLNKILNDTTYNELSKFYKIINDNDKGFYAKSATRIIDTSRLMKFFSCRINLVNCKKTFSVIRILRLLNRELNNTESKHKIYSSIERANKELDMYFNENVPLKMNVRNSAKDLKLLSKKLKNFSIPESAKGVLTLLNELLDKTPPNENEILKAVKDLIEQTNKFFHEKGNSQEEIRFLFYLRQKLIDVLNFLDNPSQEKTEEDIKQYRAQLKYKNAQEMIDFMNKDLLLKKLNSIKSTSEKFFLLEKDKFRMEAFLSSLEKDLVGHGLKSQKGMLLYLQTVDPNVDINTMMRTSKCMMEIEEVKWEEKNAKVLASNYENSRKIIFDTFYDGIDKLVKFANKNEMTSLKREIAEITGKCNLLVDLLGYDGWIICTDYFYRFQKDLTIQVDAYNDKTIDMKTKEAKKNNLKRIISDWKTRLDQWIKRLFQVNDIDAVLSRVMETDEETTEIPDMKRATLLTKLNKWNDAATKNSPKSNNATTDATNTTGASSNKNSNPAIIGKAIEYLENELPLLGENYVLMLERIIEMVNKFGVDKDVALECLNQLIHMLKKALSEATTEVKNGLIYDEIQKYKLLNLLKRIQLLFPGADPDPQLEDTDPTTQEQIDTLNAIWKC